LFVQRIELDSNFINSAISEAEAFIRLGMLPELIGRWYTKSRIATKVGGGSDEVMSSSSIAPVSSFTSSIQDEQQLQAGSQLQSNMDDLQPDMTNQLGDNEDDENVEEQRDTQNNIDEQEDRDELESDDENEKWCYCNRDESYDYMIGCDGKNCTIQWFHLCCLHLTMEQIPKGKWFCPYCKLTSKNKRTKRS